MVCSLCGANVSTPCNPNDCGYYERYVDGDNNDKETEE
jgi:hypothetical protein